MITNYKEAVTQTLNTHLSEHPRIFSNDLYELVKEQLNPKCELVDFKPWLSKFCKESSTFESVKGKYGGVRYRDEDKRVGSAATTTSDDGVTADDTEDDDEADDACSVMINSKTRIHATDKHNWCLQRLNGDLWMSKAYYQNLNEAFRGAAKKIVDGELRIQLQTAKQLNEMASVLVALEKKIEENLKKESKV